MRRIAQLRHCGRAAIASSRALLALTAVVTGVFSPVLGRAQTQQQLGMSFKFGAIATDGPLCGLRDPAWAADLQQAELRAMGVRRGDPDPAQRQLTDRADAALAYAEQEALEDFADGPADATCLPLAHNPDLAEADHMVAKFRAGAELPIW